MKVFTVHNNTDKIFSTREKTINYIVAKWLMESDFYLDFKHEALIECAGKLVVEHIVE